VVSYSLHFFTRPRYQFVSLHSSAKSSYSSPDSPKPIVMLPGGMRSLAQTLQPIVPEGFGEGSCNVVSAQSGSSLT
jgi:hypothetical protein